MALLIGLTGGIGSGKTSVAKEFETFENVVVYYADIEAKKLMNTSPVIKQQLVETFSDEVFINGKLNRTFLASLVFNHPNELKKLNAIVHPVVHKHLQNFIQTHQDKSYIIYENAILFENGSNQLCDKIITVTAPEEIRIQRVMKRDAISEEAVKSRIKNQWPDAKKILQSHYVVHNLDFNQVKNQLKHIHNKLTK